MMNELYHYGIKGQKWGVRRYQNKDGTLTPAGKKRLAKTIVATYSKHRSNPDHIEMYKAGVKTSKEVSELNSIVNSDKLVKARKKLNDIDNVSDEYFNDEKTYKKYMLKAADKMSDEIGITDAKERERIRNLYLYEDLDQGSDNSFMLYLKDKGVDTKAYGKKLYDAHEEYEKVCKQAANELLGEYGKMRIKDKHIPGYIEDANQLVKDILEEVAANESKKYYALHMLD